MKITDTSDLWWKNAVIYCVDVPTYLDWDGDGRGDLVGVSQRDRLSRKARGHVPVVDAVLSQPGQAAVLAGQSVWDDAAVVTVHNLAPHPLTVPLHVVDAPGGAALVDLLDGDEAVALDRLGRGEIALDGYGFRWLRVVGPGARRLA